MEEKEILNKLIKERVICSMAEGRRLIAQKAIIVKDNGDIQIGKNRVIKSERR